MASLATTANLLKDRYLPLIKGRQTLLLALTGLAGYLCQPSGPVDVQIFIGLAGSLLATISGCTVLNMLLDRDLDCKMERTRHRPLADGRVNSRTATWIGSGLLLFGLIWAARLSLPYFAVILSGASLNVLVYTAWLKRRTAWAIVWGGLAGGMPILAGRVLAAGRVDLLGALLALVVVCWIPSHNLALSMLYSADYRQAGVPTILNSYGEMVTHLGVTTSSILVSTILVLILNLLGLHGPILWLLFALSLALVALAIFSWTNQSHRTLAVLYKFSSIYLLTATILLLIIGLT